MRMIRRAPGTGVVGVRVAGVRVAGGLMGGNREGAPGGKVAKTVAECGTPRRWPIG